MNDICKVENLSFSYNSSRKIIEKISFGINKGEIIGILGKNGSGKTTILNLMTGFLKDYSGSITINGKDIRNFSLKERARTMSYIQQSRLLIPDYYSVENFILEGRRPFRKFGFYNEEDYALLEKVINQCGLENYRNQSVNKISGGEFQRCIFAKALMKQCDFFLFDEPTSAMDIKYQKDFFSLLTMAKQELEAAVVLSIHDINLAVKYCDRIITLKSGTIIYDGAAINISSEILSEAFETKITDKSPDEKHFYY